MLGFGFMDKEELGQKLVEGLRQETRTRLMKEHFTTRITVNGGATRQQAFAAALSQVQPSLLKESPR